MAKKTITTCDITGKEFGPNSGVWFAEMTDYNKPVSGPTYVLRVGDKTFKINEGLCLSIEGIAKELGREVLSESEQRERVTRKAENERKTLELYEQSQRAVGYSDSGQSLVDLNDEGYGPNHGR